MVDLLGLLNSELEGRYEVSTEIGRGGMAVVYLGQDLRHDRPVAVKVLLPDLAQVLGPERFLREIRIESHLRHPNILPLLDSGAVDGIPFYVMPYVQGESLADRLEREKQLPVTEVVRLGIEVADALAYAHGRGLVHRDIKPGNIMLEAGHAVVADFGIALATRDVPHGRLTASGVSPGSPLYMSPEQAGGATDLDGRSDVYSLGCVLYEALTGDAPFDARLPQAILARKLSEPAPSAAVVRESVPPALDQVIRRALARNPGDRYANAEALRDALVDVREGRARVEPVMETPLRAEATLLRRAVRAAGGAAGIVALTVCVGFLTNRVHDMRLGIPPEHAPTRSDFLALGGQALLPLLIFGLVAIVTYVVVREVVRLGGWVLHRSPRLAETLDTTTRNLRGSWIRAWMRLRPVAVANLFFVGAVVLGVAVLIPYRGILAGMALADTSGLADPLLRRSFSAVLSILILVLLSSWSGVFRWLGRHASLAGRVALARWGSLAWILVLVVVATLPWRLLWDADGERVLVDGRPGYLLKETDAAILVYDPAAGTAVNHRKGPELNLRRLGARGYPFEGPGAFPTAEGGN
ncbi:MAG TPA: serine/threonine-protein kinase [Longimicrobiales bacterium]|nr:serine/threonine-protein kinase [Longimicrobiales bacterium]